MKTSVMTPIVLLICFLLVLPGCQSAYYGALEKVGIHKRELMVDRVEEARDAQAEAKEQFQSALEQFGSVVRVRGGDLEQKYNTLNSVYEECRERAEQVHRRIESVENVSEALFDEWEDELGEYSNRSLREESRRKLRVTRRDYERLIGAMRRAEKKIYPVLAAFHDQVLYLKHNLNARALSSLQVELVAIEDDVAGLVEEMEVSIREAEQFIETLRRAG
jgi:hypothetical protein